MRRSATYVRNSRCFDEDSAEKFGQNESVAAAENNDGVTAQGLFAIELCADAFGDGELEGGLTSRRRADELLDQGRFECGLKCLASSDQLAHDADEVVLCRRFVAGTVCQRRVVVEEEVALRRGELETLGNLRSLSEFVDVLGCPGASARDADADVREAQ